MRCEGCGHKIGYDDWTFYSSSKYILMASRNNYYRICKDQDQIKSVNPNNKEGNIWTLKDYFDNIIKPKLRNEPKGIIKGENTTKDNFKSDIKLIRNLSQISYRLLSFILYSNLFFAKILNDEDNDDYDCYLINNMNSFLDLIKENWNILSNQINKRYNYNIQKFLNLVFKDISEKLFNIENINQYEDLQKIEEEIQIIIISKINSYNNYDYKLLNDKYRNSDICSQQSLFNENNLPNLYNEEKYIFYRYLFFTNYPSEIQIKEKGRLTKEEFPVIYEYLNRSNDSIKNINNLNDLIIFNEFRSLLINTYSNNITKEEAKNKKFCDEVIYKKNEELCNKFIELCNKNKKIANLKSNSSLFSFFIEEKKAPIFYEKLMKIQNDVVKPLLAKKIQSGEFNAIDQEPANIQNIYNKNELFTFDLPENVGTFNNLILNCSIRQCYNLNNENNAAIDYLNGKYKEYNINYNLLEKILADILLKNKRVLSCKNIIGITYKNEKKIDNNSTIIDFKKKYKPVDLSSDDKEYIIKCYSEYLKNRCLDFLKDIEKLMAFLNMNKIIETSISKVIESNKKRFPFSLSEDIISFFQEYDNNFEMNKLYNIMVYIEKKVFDDVKEKIKPNQEKLGENIKKSVENYFQLNDNNNKIYVKKKNLTGVLRKLMTRFIVFEKDFKKIMNENFGNYLECDDLWDGCSEININSKEFSEELGKMKNFNIKLNNVLDLYELLGGDNYKEL